MKKKTVVICIAIGVVLIISLIAILCNKQVPGGLFSNSGNQVINGQNNSNETDMGNQIREGTSEKQGLSADGAGNTDGQSASGNTVIYKEEVLVEPENEGDVGVGISVESDNSSIESIFGVTETQSSAEQENRQTSSSKYSDSSVFATNNNESQTESQSETEQETPKDTYLFDSVAADASIDYEFYINRMSPTTKQALYDAAPTPQDYLDWVAGLREKYEEENAGNVSPAEQPLDFPS